MHSLMFLKRGSLNSLSSLSMKNMFVHALELILEPSAHGRVGSLACIIQQNCEPPHLTQRNMG